MRIVFSLFGRPRELRLCFESLARCVSAGSFGVHIDVNDSANPRNDEVNEVVGQFAASGAMVVTVKRRSDGFGPDINIHRTLKQFNERVIYCAGDVLFHPECLVRYLRLNDRFPHDPITLYHSFAHPLRYEADYAVMRSFAFESLLFNPAEYLDYCLFRPWVLRTLATTDWILSWLFHKRGQRIYSEQFSYIQHLGVVGGNTSGRFKPRYALDYLDQPGFFEALRSLGVDPNVCKMVKV